jgi:hypothetical protein
MSRVFRFPLPAALAAAVLLIATPSASAFGYANLRAAFTMVTDMARPSEVLPHGVPLTMDWAAHPRVAAGNDATGYAAFIPWGQLYECSTGRVAIDPADIGAVAVVVRARLVAATVSPTLAPPCVVLSVGADYWRTTSAVWAGIGRNNVDAAIGRFKRVDLGWRVFTMTTASLPQLATQPVPVVFPRTELR